MTSISNLSAGLKLSSSGNANAIGKIALGGNPIFNSVYTATGFTNPLNTTNGVGTAGTGTGQAAVFTVNPSAQASGTIGTIVDGVALQLYVEYNSLGQFRFNVLPSGVVAQSSTGLTTPSVSSAWYPVGTEHTVGVSYNNAGYITMVVDGDFAASTTLSTVSTDPVNITQMVSTTVGKGLTIGGLYGFNGFIDQVINFRGPLSPTELAAITQDASGVAGSLYGTITPFTTGHIETAIGLRGAGADLPVISVTTSRTLGNIPFLETAAPATVAAATIGSSSLTTSSNITSFAATSIAGPGAVSAGEIRPGDYITGPGIPEGDFVSQVTGLNTIVLRTPTNAAISAGSAISIYHAQAVARQEIATSTSPSTLPSGSTVPTAMQLGFASNSPAGLNTGDIVLRLDSIAGVRGGDLVAGGGLPGGYTVYTTGILGSTDSVIITPGGSVATTPVNAGVPIYFVNPNSRDAQSINIASNNTATGSTGYVAGDQIQITAASGPNGATVTKTYIVQSSDIQSTPALTNTKIASSIVALNPTIGLYALAQNGGGLSNQIVMAPMLSTGPTFDTSNAYLAGVGTDATLATSLSNNNFKLPQIIVKSLNSAQVNENNVLDALNFSSISAGTLASSSFQAISSAFNTATLQNSSGVALTTAAGAINPGSLTYSGNASVLNAVTAKPVIKGPIYAELSNFSITGTTGTGVYDLFINSSYVKNGSLNSLGFIVNPSIYAPSGTIVSLVPTVNNLITINNGTLGNSNSLNGSVSSLQPSGTGSLYQSNLIDGSMNFQWVSTSGVSDFSKPVARLTVLNAESSQSSFASMINRISINNGYIMDTENPTLSLVESLDLPSQIYSVKGTVYQQYNKGSSSPDLSFNATAVTAGQQVIIPGTDMTFVVKNAPANINLNLQPVTSPVTVASPNPVVKIDVVDTLLAPGTNTFTYNINVPSNASNVSFTPGLGVSGVTVVNNGGFLTVSGTYGGTVTTTTTSGTPPVTTTVTTPAVLQNTSTPTLGTLTATLNNMMTSVNGVVSGGGTVGSTTNLSKGSQFSIDSALLNGAPATAQSLYFGAAETNASGAYTLSNLPLGQLTLNVYNNTAQAASKVGNISLNDAMSALTMAAGRGVVTSTAVGTASNLDVSDFVAADFNKDGKVTAADSLAILQYFVNYSNLNSAPLSYTYFPASQQGFLGTGKVGVANSVAPAMTAISTNINALNSTPLGIGGQQTLDIVGVLQGDVV